MTTPDGGFGYDVDGLRAADAALGTAARLAEACRTALTDTPAAPAIFGRTPGAAALDTALAAAQAGFAGDARSEQQRAAGIAHRATTCAALGSQLTDRTTGIARTATPETR